MFLGGIFLQRTNPKNRKKFGMPNSDLASAHIGPLRGLKLGESARKRASQSINNLI